MKALAGFRVPEYNRRNMRLLIVDDSAIIRRALSKLLAGFGPTEILEAEDGEVAMNIFRKSRPEWVTLAVTMPKIDGLSCLKEMLALAPETRVLLITARSGQTTALTALELGARGVVIKPFTEAEVKEGFAEAIAE